MTTTEFVILRRRGTRRLEGRKLVAAATLTKRDHGAEQGRNES
jgi:hypothetical protein